MSVTPNYALQLHSNTSTRFKQFREDISGETDSNMIKIDTALGEKADKSISVNVTLQASAWTGEAAPYEQIVSVAGISGAQQNGFITISKDATDEQNAAAVAAVISVTDQQKDQMTLSCSGVKPSIDIPAMIILIN